MMQIHTSRCISGILKVIVLHHKAVALLDKTVKHFRSIVLIERSKKGKKEQTSSVTTPALKWYR